MNKLKEYANKNPQSYWILFLCVCILIPLVLVTVGKAVGAERQCSFSNPDTGCHTPAQLAKKFREGRIHHTHGIPNRAFAHPAQAKKVIVAKTVRYLKHHPKKVPAVKRVVARYHAQVSRCCSIPTNWITKCHVVCLSLWSYARAHEKDSCAGDFLHNSIPGLCTPGTHPMTKGELQAGGAVTICAGLLVIGVLSAPETAGTGTVALGAAAGGLSCGWSFWSAIDPG